jgi:hypothetical protein
VPQAGWAGKSNGELLRLAAGRFEAFITVDQGLQYQQNLQGAPLGVIALRAPTNRIEHLRPLIPEVLKVLAKLTPGQYVAIP